MMFCAPVAHLAVATSAGGQSARLPLARRLAGVLAFGLRALSALSTVSALSALSAAPAQAMSDAPEAPQPAASNAGLRICNTA